MAAEQRNVSTLAGLIVEIRKLNSSKGWRDTGAEGDKTGPWFAAYCALAHSEISEMLEAYRDKQWSSTRPVITAQGELVGKPIGVGPEMADALIRILDMIDIWGIDIEYELARVLDYGWTRPYQHGGKVL